MCEDGLREEGRVGRQQVGGRGPTAAAYAFARTRLEEGGRRDVVVDGEAIFPGRSDGDMAVEVEGIVAVGDGPDGGGEEEQLESRNHEAMMHAMWGRRLHGR